MINTSAPSDAYPSAERFCVCGASLPAAKPKGRPRKWCSRRCCDQHRWLHRDPLKPWGGGKSPMTPCLQCGRPVRKRYGPSQQTGLCLPCYWATKRNGSHRLNQLIKKATSDDRAVTRPALNFSQCCGWTVAGQHTYKLPSHHAWVNRYMRNRYRHNIEWQMSYMLGTGSKAAQANMPRALVELAITRRKLMDAARLTGKWRVIDAINDVPGRDAGSPIRPDPQG